MKQDETALAQWLRTLPPAQVVQALAECVPDAAVFAVDASRRVVSWSAGAETLLGFSPQDMVGEHCLKGNRCAECMQGCGVAQHGTVNGITLELFGKDGKGVLLQKYAQAFTDPQGAFLGAVEVLVPTRKPVGLPVVAGPSANAATAFHGVLTQSPQMLRLFDTVRNVARTEVSVLVRGESGAGKELFARAIHNESTRRSGPFLAVNCAAISPALLESELFGHEKGAFTGATQTHHGMFERADAGTLFLDEVAELPLDLQAKLLRVLEARTFLRVGGRRDVTVDVRLVAATHRSLRREVAAGRFRQDLMYRLRVVPLFLPPLRDRTMDIPLLLDHFLSAQPQTHRRLAGFSPDAMRVLLAWPWPGNVRELRNVVEYASAVARAPVAGVEDLPPEMAEVLDGTTARGGTAPLPASAPNEAARIRHALEQADGQVGEAARLLGMSRPTFWRRRKALGI